MRVISSIKDKVLTISMYGELDECSADNVRKEVDNLIIKTTYSAVIFDMQGLTFMDSTGIGVLLGRYKLLKKSGIVAYITNCSSHIDRILTMSGIYKIIKKIS